MNVLFVDLESTVTKQIRLSKMTLRQYLAAANLTGISWAVNDDPTQYLDADADGQFPNEFVEWLESICCSPDWVWVSHNAAFDVRAGRRKLGLTQPAHVHCTLELAHAAFPNQPGGYKLKKLAETLELGMEKIDLDLTRPYTKEQLAAYCTRDTDLCRLIYKRCIPRIPPNELKISELANQVRELWFEIKPERVQKALEDFSHAAASAVADALGYLDRDGDEIEDAVGAFGWLRRPGSLGEDDPGVPKSIKPARLKRLLLDRLGFDTRTITWKKINPQHLTDNIPAANTLRQTSRANKAFSHSRRVAVFASATEVDAELGYFRAHTGRFSSPSVGRGLNLHNLPKHDKAIAKPVRQMFVLPQGLCFVRADLANVEYRIEGWMTNCDHTKRLFTDNILADPYSEFGAAGTGIVTVKGDPARQVFKAGVLLLGFMAGVGMWMSNLLLLISDASNGVSLTDLDLVCQRQKWTPVGDRWVRAQQNKLNAPWQVAAVAYHTRLAFHRIHPEFKACADWLMYTLQKISGAVDKQLAIEMCYRLPNAPDRNKLNLEYDGGLSGCSVRAICGPWTRTVAWRDIGIHDTPFGVCFSNIMAGNKGYRKLTPNVVIENVVQSCARNAICAAKLELDKRGWHYLLSVHDEILIVCNRDRNTVLAARQDLLEVLGPGNALGWDWAATVNPDEINVSESLFEQDMGELLEPIGTKADGKPKYHPSSTWWGRLGMGDENLLDNLP